jgi:hypothetical protein
VALNTGIEYGKKKEGRLFAAVWRMTSHAFTTGHRTVTHSLAEETRMARAARCHHQVCVHLHSVAGIVATAALPLHHGPMSRGEHDLRIEKCHRHINLWDRRFRRRFRPARIIRSSILVWNLEEEMHHTITSHL